MILLFVMTLLIVNWLLMISSSEFSKYPGAKDVGIEFNSLSKHIICVL